MATSYTTLLGLALPVEGELDGVWGDVVNNSITQLVEDAIANSATADVTSGNWTLATTGSGLSNQARMSALIPTGTPGVTRSIIAPSHSKAYVIINQSNASVVIKGAATTGATIAAGKTSIVVWNGSDFVEISPTNATNATNATNLTNGAAGRIPYQSATGTTGFIAVGTSGQYLSSAGAGAPVWVNPPGFSLLATVTPANGVVSASVTGLSPAKNIQIITEGLVLSGISSVRVALSSTNGSSYGSIFSLTNGNNTTPTGYASFFRCDAGSSNKPLFTLNSGGSGVYNDTSVTGIVNAIQFTTNAGVATFTGVGSIYIYGAT